MPLSVRDGRRRSALADPEAAVLIPPDTYIQAVRSVLGVIDLDPCSTSAAQQAIDAQGWYRASEAEAALAEPWAGRVFLHPHPDTLIARFQLQKLLRDYLADRVTAAIILCGRTDWLRSEPLLLSFPFLLHYKRLPHWKVEPCSDGTRSLTRINPSFNSVTISLPAKDGTHFDEDALNRFLEAFSPFGRIILAEDLGEAWEQHALTASQRMPVAPVLPVQHLERWTA